MSVVFAYSMQMSFLNCWCHHWHYFLRSCAIFCAPLAGLFFIVGTGSCVLTLAPLSCIVAGTAALKLHHCLLVLCWWWCFLLLVLVVLVPLLFGAGSSSAIVLLCCTVLAGAMAFNAALWLFLHCCCCGCCCGVAVFVAMPSHWLLSHHFCWCRCHSVFCIKAIRICSNIKLYSTFFLLLNTCNT